MSAISTSNEREINPMQLSIEQLHTLRQQHEEEIQEMQKQLDSLAQARNRFLSAKSSLNDIAETPSDNFLYVPLSSSLYVPGHVVNPDKVMVELGTGYFCEKTISEAKDLIDRKSQLITKSIETIEGVGINKKKNLSQLNQIIQYKMSM